MELQALQQLDTIEPLQCLYKEPCDLDSFRELLEQQRAFEPRLKSHLQDRIRNRHLQLSRLATKYAQDEQEWHAQVRFQESTAADRAELGHQPSTHHIPSLLHIQQQQQQQQISRSNRRPDVVRSEEEMNRVIQTLLEQDRDNPETRWLATAATPPLQWAASPKCLFTDRFVDHNRLMYPTTTDDPLPCPAEAVWTEAEERVLWNASLALQRTFDALPLHCPSRQLPSAFVSTIATSVAWA